MRLKLIDRVLAAISGVLILAVGIGLLVFGAGIFPFKLDLSFLERQYVLWQRAAMVAAALVLCFLGLRGISMLFRTGREKGFIAQHTEYGDLSISMTAMESMVKRCVDSHDELKVSNTRIYHARDGVVVSIRISLANGVNIPITVSALQKQIKQYITSCSGVDVKEVRVMVETNNNPAPGNCETGGSTLLVDVDTVDKAEVNAPLGMEQADVKTKAAREPLHQRLFKREEKPQIVPEPPAMDAEKAEDEPPEPAEAPTEPENGLENATVEMPANETNEESTDNHDTAEEAPHTEQELKNDGNVTP